MKVYFLIIYYTIIHQSKSSQISSNNESISNLNSTHIPANFSCNTSLDCNNHGICNTTTRICLCYMQFDTFFPPNSTVSPSMCNYEKKKQITAFLLSFLAGFGAEHFYLGNISLGAAKLVFYIFCYGINFILLILYKFSEKFKPYLEFIGDIEFTYLLCAFISILLWNIYDWVNIISNVYLDENNIPLMAWS